VCPIVVLFEETRGRKERKKELQSINNVKTQIASIRKKVLWNALRGGERYGVGERVRRVIVGVRLTKV
jgi:hypothetical protein